MIKNIDQQIKVNKIMVDAYDLWKIADRHLQALYDELSGNHYRDIYRDAAEIRYGGESGEKKRALDLYQEPGYPAVP